jgi:DNA-binding transcriptional regulator of glucitol operon
VLKNNGLILFSTFGPNTLKELKKSWAVVDNKPHVNTEEHLILWTIVGVIIIVLALLIIGNIATTRFASAFDLFIKKVPL